VASTSGVYIDGQWRLSDQAEEIVIYASHDESVAAVIHAGSVADIDDAVIAAAAAVDVWRWVPRATRTAALRAIADGLEARTEELAAVASLEVGSPMAYARNVQVGLALQVLRTTADAMDILEDEESIDNAIVTREPVGVVAAITPWNFPLYQVVAKIAPALAAGCAVVLKPAGVASLSAIALFEEMAKVGLPPGTVNLVCGSGRVIGEALVTHPLVDMVSFTGSTGAGIRIGELAAKDVKKVALELGGKSATVLLSDADLEKAVPAALAACFSNNGQVCSALTRLIVLKSQQAQVEELLIAAIANYPVGDPQDSEVKIGPMASASQRDSVAGYIQAGINEGARVLAGSIEKLAGLGYFVQPVIFTDVASSMKIAQEEIFGPVLVVIPVDDEAEALVAANDSDYGLAGAVWSQDRERAVEFGRRIRAGQISINGGAFNAKIPFGGFKKSGVGRELGRFGLEEYFEFKAFRF
jgi:acyl-CoA reductase-like NAD-dependent aldehyde dehydrogenase